jgi:hypothetical protein
MELSEEHKKEVSRRLVETIITSLQEDLLSADDYDEVADFVVTRMDAVKTNEELMQFLRELSSKWKIFTHVLVVESAATRDQAEDKVYDNAVALAESGKLDEALTLAKSATEAEAVDVVQPVAEPVAPVAVPEQPAVVPTEGGQAAV